MRWLLTGGEVADITQAKSLLEGLKADAVLADKGYDADALIDSIQVAGATAVIPPRRNRVVQRSYDRHLYKERNLVERFFNRIKQFRRIATRYEKLARNYLSFLNLVCTYFWQAMRRKQMSGPHDFTHRDWIGGDRQHQRH